MTFQQRVDSITATQTQMSTTQSPQTAPMRAPSLQGRQVVPCRFGTKCIKPECLYFHQNGRDIDKTSRFTYAVTPISPQSSLPPTPPPPSFAPQPVYSQAYLGLQPVPPTSCPYALPSAPQITPPTPSPVLRYTSHANPYFIDFLLNQWGDIFQKLDVNDIENICNFCKIESLGFPQWSALLKALVLNKSVREKSVEEDMSQIFQAIDREDLYALPRGTIHSDGSITIEDLIPRIKRLAGKTLFLVDGDNFPNAPGIVLDMYSSLPPKVKLPFLVASFVSASANFKAFQRAIDKPWFAFVHSQTNAKDAADHVLTIMATIAHREADINSTFCILSRDGFAREVVESLKTIKVKKGGGFREIKLLSPQLFEKELKLLNPGLELDVKTIPYQSPGYGQRKIPLPPVSRSPYSLDEEDKFKVEKEDPKESYHGTVPQYSFEGKTASLSEGIFNEWDQRCHKFLELLYKTFILNKVKNVRLSILGVFLREQHVYHETAGLRDFINYGVDEGFMVRQGEQGEAEVVFSFEAFENWADKWLDGSKKTLASPQLLQTDTRLPHVIRSRYSVDGDLEPDEQEASFTQPLPQTGKIDSKSSGESSESTESDDAGDIKAEESNPATGALLEIPWKDYACKICGTPGGAKERSHYIWRCPELQKSEKVSIYSVDDEEGNAEKIEGPKGELAKWKQQFEYFLEVIYKIYIVRDQMTVRLSTLGSLMGKAPYNVYTEKGGLKPLIQYAVELGFLQRRGEQGNAEVVFNKEAFQNWNNKRMKPL